MQRLDCMRLLALAPELALENAYAALQQNAPQATSYTLLRPAETGLIMARGRINNNGSPFNIGEVLITRCVVQREDGALGYAWIAGEKARHAELAAFFDALFQHADFTDYFNNELLPTLQSALHAKHVQNAEKAEKTRVNFFTLVRGED